MTDYQIDVYDLDGGLVLSDLPALGPVTYGEVLNAPGASTIRCSMAETDVNRTNLEPGERDIRVVRDGETVWGGYLWSADCDFDEETVTFTSEGYYSRLRRWYPLDDLFFVNVDQFHIVRDLIDYVQSGAIPGGGSADYSQDFGWNVVTNGNSGVTRKRNWCCPPTESIADFIDELAAHDNGFDFAWHPNKDVELWSPRRGVVTSAHFVWSRNPDQTSNVWRISDASIDGHDSVTLLIGLPPDDGCFECADLTLVEPLTGAHEDSKGILMETHDMTHIRDSDSREHHAREYLRIHKHNRQQVTIETPLLPWGNYEVGDIVMLTAEPGYIHWTLRQMRVISWTVTVDGGNEKATVMLDSQVDEN